MSYPEAPFHMTLLHSR